MAQPHALSDMPRQITALTTTVIDDAEWLYAACTDGSVWYCSPSKPGWCQLSSIPDPEPPNAPAGTLDYAGLVPSDSRCLDLIQSQLDGKEWNADTLSVIAELVRGTGRCIDDLEQGER